MSLCETDGWHYRSIDGEGDIQACRFNEGTYYKTSSISLGAVACRQVVISWASKISRWLGK